jgi:hypothetical protein
MTHNETLYAHAAAPDGKAGISNGFDASFVPPGTGRKTRKRAGSMRRRPVIRLWS